MLCNNALRAYSLYGRYNDSSERGLLVNYDSLPGSIARVVLPTFGIYTSDFWLSRMAIGSKHYSKSKSGTIPFVGDSLDKEERATSEIKVTSYQLLVPPYEKMLNASGESLLRLSPSLFSKISSFDDVYQHVDISWAALRDIPVTTETGGDVPLASPRPLLTPLLPLVGMEPLVATFVNSSHRVRQSNGLRASGHSVFDEHQYVPWAPFSNTHDSKPFEVHSRLIKCIRL